MKEIAGKFGLFTSKSLDIGGRKKSQTYTSCLLFNLLLLFINVLCFFQLFRLSKIMAFPRNQEWSFTRMLSSIIIRPILSLLRWFGVRQPHALTFDSIKVFVKISEGSKLMTVPLDLPRDWNVGQVKEYLVNSSFIPEH